MLLNQVWLLATGKINMRQRDVGRGKGVFNQNAGSLGRWWTQCSPQNHLQRFWLAMEVLRGRRELTSVNHWDGGSECMEAHQLLVIVLSMLSRLYSLVTQFLHEIMGGEARTEIWSSVNYLFFLSTSLIYRKSRQVRQGIVWLNDLQCVLRPELIRVSVCLVHHNRASLNWHEKGLPPEGSFLYRAAYVMKLHNWYLNGFAF